MMIKCKECGADISNRAKFCPKCGCPNSSNSKMSISSLVLGIIAIVYAFGSCLNDFFTEDTQNTILPAIVIMGLISVLLGVVSIKKTNKNKKTIIGIVLGFLAIVISIIGRLVL